MSKIEGQVKYIKSMLLLSDRLAASKGSNFSLVVHLQE